MTRPRAFAAPRLCLAVLFGLGCLVPATAMQPPDCPPPARPRATAPPPLLDDNVRPVAAKQTKQAKQATPQVPTAPFPPAGLVSRAAPSDLPVPSVAVRVRVPAEVSSGQEITYQIIAENVSRAEAHHVTVRVPTPANAKYVSSTPEPAEKEPAIVWKLGTLRGGEKREIKLVASPTGDGEISCCARVQFEHGQCVKTKLLRPGVQVKKSGPREGAKYDILKFRIEVSNTGKVKARGVVVEETLPVGLGFVNSKPSTPGENPLVWDIGDLEPGKSRVIEYDATPDNVGTYTTKAVVKAAGDVRRESSHTVKVSEPALAVVKSGPKQRVAGRPATYRLTVRNTGGMAATHVELSDELPAEIEYVSSTAGGKLDRDHVRWDLGTLPAGGSKTVQVTVKAKMAGTFKNVCTATADRGLAEQAKTETKFDAPAGLALELEKGDDPPANQPATWTLRVLNRGKANETNVSAVIRLPEGVRALEVPGVPKAKIEEGKILLPVLASLPPGKDATVTFRVQAEKAGRHEIVAEAVSDANGPDAPARAAEALDAGEPTTRTSLRPGRKGPEKAEFVR